MDYEVSQPLHTFRIASRITRATTFTKIFSCYRLENVNVRRIHSQAKVLGTIVTVGGAMAMTMFDGPMLNLPWTNHKLHHESAKPEHNQISIKGAVMISSGCVSWSSFIILQVSVFCNTLIQIQSSTKSLSSEFPSVLCACRQSH